MGLPILIFPPWSDWVSTIVGTLWGGSLVDIIWIVGWVDASAMSDVTKYWKIDIENSKNLVFFADKSIFLMLVNRSLWSDLHINKYLYKFWLSRLSKASIISYCSIFGPMFCQSITAHQVCRNNCIRLRGSLPYMVS